jgi:tetratricopeptide (TPR) repeat protein
MYTRLIVGLIIFASGICLFAQDDSLESRGFKIRRTTPDGKSATVIVPRGYAVVVGVGEYQTLDHKYFLRFAQSDAQAVYRTLISPEGGAFPAENVHLLLGKDATFSNIRHELEEWLPTVTREPDRVVVYFAGHGVVDGGSGYFVPYDADIGRLRDTSYAMKRIGSVMAGKVKARWKVLLADTCHSGKITPESSNDSIDASLGEMPKTFLTFSATRENEQSFEDPALDGGYGLFSYYLVRALSGFADLTPCDGVVTADELVEYVRSEVRSYARRHSAIQTPNERGGFDDDMILALGKGCTADTQATRKLTGTLIIEVNMGDVLVYLDGEMQGIVQPNKPLSLPGIPAGLHTISGIRKGYDPDTKQISVVPGEDRTVTINIRYPERHKKSAEDHLRKGEKLLFSHRSSWSLVDTYAPRSDLEGARSHFLQALEEEPAYALASYRLAQTDILMSRETEALRYFRDALKEDPANMDARNEYAGALLESGDPDGAIRQLLEVLRVRPSDDFAISLMARAFLDKSVWAETVKYSDQAIRIRPDNEEAHLWRAAALRELARRNTAEAPKLFERSAEDFRQFLRLTDFSTSLGSQIGFYFIGFGVGSRNHADREIAYRMQRVWAYTGLCHCEEKLGQFLSASKHCQRALAIDNRDPTAHFYLANVYRDLFNRSLESDSPECHLAANARAEYAETVRINPDLEESRMSTVIMASIDKVLPAVHCK